MPTINNLWAKERVKRELSQE